VINLSLHKGNLRPRFKQMFWKKKLVETLHGLLMIMFFFALLRYFFRGGFDENSISPWFSKNHNHSSMIVLLRFISFLKRKIGRNFFMVSPQQNYFPLKFNHNNFFSLIIFLKLLKM